MDHICTLSIIIMDWSMLFCIDWEIKWQGSHDNLCFSRIHTTTPVILFPNQYKEVYFNPYIYAKVTCNP